MEVKQITGETTTLYVCSVCGKESGYKRTIETCEKRHNCAHEPRYEYKEASDDSWWFNVKGVSSICKHCGEHLGFADFEDVDDLSDCLEKIFNIVLDNSST